MAGASNIMVEVLLPLELLQKLGLGSAILLKFVPTEGTNDVSEGSHGL